MVAVWVGSHRALVTADAHLGAELCHGFAADLRAGSAAIGALLAAAVLALRADAADAVGAARRVGGEAACVRGAAAGAGLVGGASIDALQVAAGALPHHALAGRAGRQFRRAERAAALGRGVGAHLGGRGQGSVGDDVHR